MNESLRLSAKTARAGVRAGALRGAPFRELLASIAESDRDAWVDELFAIEELPRDDPHLPRGSVPYLPCEVDAILAMVREAPVRASDHVVDLGSGIGRAVILAHLLSGARASGVEIQEHLVESANTRRDDLALSDVSFVHGDAADTPLEGSVFFLYAPFNGDMLTRVLRNLESVARRRAIVVAAVGIELRDVPWSVPRTTSRADLTLYDSHSHSHSHSR